ncbi:MAG: helix-turn-helix domain-containing protein, partial [Candidatus Thorarchaeota archaeon]|nr:helix-turn-helix domain-containing protein [Candidatus Thorarchaeota archaeon]
MVEEKNELRSLEEEVFKTLSHQIRRDILRFIGETKGAKFTEIKKAIEISESASLSYHLTALEPFIVSCTILDTRVKCSQK